MSIFLKAGYWSSKKKGNLGELDLDIEIYKYATDVITTSLNLKLQTVSSISELKTYTSSNFAYFDGSTWEKKSGNLASNGGSYAGTIINVSSSFYWERISDYYTPEMFGAVGDGLTNDANKIQSAINATAIGGTLMFANKTYFISSRLTINKSIKITGGLNSIVTTNGQNIIELLSCSNVKIENIKFYSTLNSTNADLFGLVYAFNKQLTNITIINCYFSVPNVPQNGIKIITDLTGSYIEKLNVEKCTFESIGRMGVEIQNHLFDGVYRSNNITIKDCIFKDLGMKIGVSPNGVEHYGMAISFSGLGRNNNSINNIIDNPYDIGIEYASGAGSYSTIANNNFINITRVNTEKSNANVFVLSVTTTGNLSCDNLAIYKNYCISTTSVAACRFQNLKYANIYNNDFNLKQPIYFFKMMYSTISNNIFISREAYSVYTTSDNPFFPVAYNIWTNNTFDVTTATGVIAPVVFEEESKENIIEGGTLRRLGDSNIMINFGSATNNKMVNVKVNSLPNSTVFNVSMTDADKTLEEFQVQSGFIEITGTLTATRILYVPLTNRPLYIKNSTNNSLEIRLRGQTVTGVTLPSTNSKTYLVEISKNSTSWISI
jgi:hypothetical protein